MDKNNVYFNISDRTRECTMTAISLQFFRQTSSSAARHVTGAESTCKIAVSCNNAEYLAGRVQTNQSDTVACTSLTVMSNPNGAHDERTRQRSLQRCCCQNYRATGGRTVTPACHNGLRTTCAASAAGQSSAFVQTVCNAVQVFVSLDEPQRQAVRRYRVFQENRRNLHTRTTSTLHTVIKYLLY